MSSGPGLMFGAFAVFVGFMGLLTLAFFGLILFLLVRRGRTAYRQYRYDMSQPVRSIHARVVSKRHEAQTSGGMGDLPVSTSNYYYCTFEIASGKREEYQVDGPQYGVLVEGDTGVLSYQGSRFVAYERES